VLTPPLVILEEGDSPTKDLEYIGFVVLDSDVARCALLNDEGVFFV